MRTPQVNFIPIRIATVTATSCIANSVIPSGVGPFACEWSTQSRDLVFGGEPIKTLQLREKSPKRKGMW